MNFGQQLRAERLEAGLSLNQMAAKLGVTRPAVCHVEGSDNVREQTLRNWAKVLGLEVVLELKERKRRRRSK